MSAPAFLCPVALLALLPAAPALAQDTTCGAFDPTAVVQTCTCGAGPHNRPVWGGNPYTGDSDICTAAQHAGVLGPEGGEVFVRGVEPPQAFTGSTANGVAASDWGGYPTAFTFKGSEMRSGPPVCRFLGEAEELTCQCEAEISLASVYGSNPYTDDSDICSAALHAGVVGPEGGLVTVRRAPGQASYQGSTAHGVTSWDYGPWSGSIIVAPAVGP